MESDVSMKIREFNVVLITIIKKFSESNTNLKNSQTNKYRQIDIELSKENNGTWIQITHCGHHDILNQSNVIHFILDELTKSNILPNDDPSIVLEKQAKNDYEEIYDLTKENFVKRISHNISFPHLKEYLSVKVQYKLPKITMEQFKEMLCEELKQLVNDYSHIKYTFQSGDNCFFTNHVEFDEICLSSQLLSSALTRVLRQTLNGEFRRKVHELLNIEHSGAAEDAIMMRLLSLFSDNYQFDN